MLRIVHAADIHLDTPYRRHDEVVRARLLEAGREAFVRLIDLALERRADALLIAGDLFDNELLTLATERVLVDELTRATSAGLTVVYATGNHDPGRANYRAMGIDWPEEHFHLVASRQPRQIAIEREGEVVGWVVAAGHQTPREDRDLAAAFPPAPGPEPAVALLHAQVMSAAAAEQHDRYAPAALDSLEPSYAYWALGHIHQRQEVRPDPPVHYPGNVQGRHFGEDGAKGALVVTLDRGAAPEIEFAALAPVRWEVLEPTGLEAARNLTDVHSAVRAAFDARRHGAPPDQEWILRVDLHGACPLASLLADADERTELATQLREDLGVLDVEVRDRGLHRPVDIESHRDQPHLLGQTLVLLEEAKSDDSVLDRIAPEDVAGGDRGNVTEHRKYLRDLLRDLDAEAAVRLLRESESA
ncbi:MAG: DNA repair exonuclease [Chloroflexi bacterium]|nr:DNA repair exonuclease [Chloroflexota bacterium]